jgi:hypothetical protein
LAFSDGDGSNTSLAGQTEVLPRTWHHVALVRTADSVAVYLDGRLEIEGRIAPHAVGSDRLLIGGDNGPDASLEGKLDETAVYDRSLTAGEIEQHFQAASINH